MGIDAPIAFGSSLSQTLGRAPKRQKVADTPWQAAATNPWPAPAAASSGPHSANRRNTPLCDAFQHSACGPPAPGNKCPNDSSKVHQCSRCLSDRHGADSCPGSKGKSGKGKRGSKGKTGKGKKGKGKNGKGKGKGW